MSQIPSTANAVPSSQPLDNAGTLNELDLNDFLDLMIAELQNQDPLNPLENHQLLAQISQIREVGATDRLTETLDSVLLGQNVVSATNLIGTEVHGKDDAGEPAAGVVERVSITGGKPRLTLFGKSQAHSDPTKGELEAGEYRYTVTYNDDEGKPVAIELGPVVTTGTPGLDRSVKLRNLPTSKGPKTVYRTDASGEGAPRLVGLIPDGRSSEYIDSMSNQGLSSATAPAEIVRQFGSRTVEISLDKVTEVIHKVSEETADRPQ